MFADYPEGGEPTRNESVAVATSQALFSYQHERQEIIVSNNSTAAQIAAGHKYVTISIGKEAVDGAGIVLLPGMTLYGSMNSEFRVSSESMYAIANGGAGTIAIFER